MKPYLLLILLSSWANVVPLSLQCETGVAYPNHGLSFFNSLAANADVALLKKYHAETLDKCITECCAENYGSCTVASFTKNVNESNCKHFNCRPVNKCKFVSSNSTDSFSFTSSSSPHILVPSSHASKNDSLSSTKPSITTYKPTTKILSYSEQEHGVTKEAVATYSDDQLAYKDDNTTIKPRKGVDDITEDSLENVSRSGVKPRKGVNLDGVTNTDNTKSKVKPRKGVGPYQSQSIFLSGISVEPTSRQMHLPTTSLVNKTYQDMNADDLVSALQQVFEDDIKTIDIKPSTASSIESFVNIEHTSDLVHSFIPTTASTTRVTSSTEKTSSVLQSSLATKHVASSSVQTPDLLTTPIEVTEVVYYTPMPSSSSPTILEHSKLLFQELPDVDATKSKLSSSETEDSVESESERKYKSSMHLVLSLVFGLLVLFSVLGVVAKRVYDSWMRRHYRRMDFLIDGMYNGFG